MGLNHILEESKKSEGWYLEWVSRMTWVILEEEGHSLLRDQDGGRLGAEKTHSILWYMIDLVWWEKRLHEVNSHSQGCIPNQEPYLKETCSWVFFAIYLRGKRRPLKIVYYHRKSWWDAGSRLRVEEIQSNLGKKKPERKIRSKNPDVHSAFDVRG